MVSFGAGFRNGIVNLAFPAPGVTGFIVESTDEAINACCRLGELDRGRIRATFERRFSVERMAGEYLDVYRDLLHKAGTDRLRQVA